MVVARKVLPDRKRAPHFPRIRPAQKTFFNESPTESKTTVNFCTQNIMADAFSKQPAFSLSLFFIHTDQPCLLTQGFQKLGNTATWSAPQPVNLLKNSKDSPMLRSRCEASNVRGLGRQRQGDWDTLYSEGERKLGSRACNSSFQLSD